MESIIHVPVYWVFAGHGLLPWTATLEQALLTGHGSNYYGPLALYLATVLTVAFAIHHVFELPSKMHIFHAFEVFRKRALSYLPGRNEQGVPTRASVKPSEPVIAVMEGRRNRCRPAPGSLLVRLSA